MVNTKQKPKQKALLQILYVLAVLLLFNLIAARLFFRIDLTAEKRYSLSVDTKKLLAELPDVVHFKVYLEGDFPPGFQKFSRSINDMLLEMRREAGSKISFEFINPQEEALRDEKSTNELFQQLMDKGLQPTDLQVKKETGLNRQVIWPGALVYYRQNELPLNLLKSATGGSPQAVINSSEEALEYELANAIKKVITLEKPRIFITQGQGELNKNQLFDLGKSLSEQYEVETYRLGRAEPIPPDVKLLIIAKPDSAFSEWSKYKIDNFIMNGGRVLFLLDKLRADMDSMGPQGYFMALDNESNLDDQLFKYGVRVNADLIQDLKSGVIPVVYGTSGNKPLQDLFPWYYYPLVSPATNHPIVKKIDPVFTQFVSTIDTLPNGIQKTVLLATSSNTKVIPSPVRVNLGLVNDEPKPENFKMGSQAVAVLLEGNFESLYKNRPLAPFAKKAIDSLGMQMRTQSLPTKIIVVSDGDIAKNYVRKSDGGVLPLGMDRFSKEMYGNKNFLLNAVDYLLDDTGLIQVRAKEITLRLIKPSANKQERTQWQLFNIGLPLLLLTIFGLFFVGYRKWKYTK